MFIGNVSSDGTSGAPKPTYQGQVLHDLGFSHDSQIMIDTISAIETCRFYP